MASQTIQGADLLAARLNAVVLIPDFFDGAPLKHEYVPADTEEKKQIIAEFMAHKADIARNVGVATEAVQEYRARFPAVRKWGAFGLCWGGKASNAFDSVGGRLRADLFQFVRGIGDRSGIWAQHPVYCVGSNPPRVRLLLDVQ